MKKLLLSAAIVMAAGVKAQDVAVTVNGVYDVEGAKVALIDAGARKVTSAVVENGKFTISTTAKKNAMLNIRCDKLGWVTLMINDGTPVTVNLNDSTLKGSAQNERLVNYDLAMNSEHATMGVKEGLQKIFSEEKNSLVPVAFLEQYVEEFGLDNLKKLMEAKPLWASHPDVQNNIKMFEYMAAEQAKKAAIIGKQFIDLEEADTEGKMHKLSEYVGKGKWVLVDFWASWCGPCRAEMPNVVAAYEKYHAKGFDIVGLSFDNKKEPWVKAIGDLKMPWAHLSDLKGWKTVAAGVYGVNSIPDNLLIDPQGKIVARGLRAKGLHDKLKEIFGE